MSTDRSRTSTDGVRALPSEMAIRAVSLTKHYPIAVGGHTERNLSDGALVAQYQTLRETLSSLPSQLLHRDRLRKERFYALREVTFDVSAGTVLGIIGRNGAGKTTLLKILSRITEPSAGYAQIRGTVGSLLEVGTGFHPELTGRENIFLSGAILGMSHDEIKRRMSDIVEYAEVGQFLDTPLKRFSAGMYLRLAFAVAAHLETEIMLIDEILAVGDLQFRQRSLRKIQDVGRGGRTVIYISHDMSSIRQSCDRVIWLDKGRIVADGPTAEITSRYETQVYATPASETGVFHRPVTETKSQAIWFDRVEIRSAEGRPCATFRWGDSLRMIMTLAGEAPFEPFAIDWYIYNERGERVAYGASNPQQDVYFDRDDRVVECEIGPLTLTSGQYRFWLRVWVGMDHPQWDVWDGAATFQIVLADPFSSGFDATSALHGSVVLPHRWRKLERRTTSPEPAMSSLPGQ